ncbi:MAG: arginine--tRNA ligase [Marinilabiliales bacterium]|nr:MAG: arginine--tRNA ligase [Marinilabiliales bacterium]
MEKEIKQVIAEALSVLYEIKSSKDRIQIQKTRKEFAGDYTFNVFPFLKEIRKAPEQAGNEIGQFLVEKGGLVHAFNVIKGFVNLEIKQDNWIDILNTIAQSDFNLPEKNEKVVIEYSSPNTNKPLHLGHIRNNLLGDSLSRILKASGRDVIQVNLVNDRGIHICKSMLAWEKWGNGETPENAGLKGDKLVGNYYVKFDQENKKLVSDNNEETELLKEAREMLRKWEKGDEKVCALWEKMNNWVYKGFEETYKRLGITFDKIYYESETYKLGKDKVLKGLEKGILLQKDDQSVWADLTDHKLDEKILLRADGTSVYMTQDIGTAILRHQDFSPNKMIYVVGNEQDYHFTVLKIVLKKLGYEWSEFIEHFSYGMVELPHGKMKSREGTVVDADDLMEEVVAQARKMAEESDKLSYLSEEEKANVFELIGLGALKYYILKVDPRKNMMFNPEESVQLQGNTGPFIQYSYARSKSVLRKAAEQNIIIPERIDEGNPDEKEVQIIKLLADYKSVLEEAGKVMSPALIANYAFTLAKEFNQFYYDHAILKEENEQIRNLRLLITAVFGEVIKHALSLLGITSPERM